MRHGRPRLLSGGIGDSPQINDVGQCWNPGGSELIVIGRGLRELGIWRPDTPNRVQDLGRMPGQAVRGCSWLSRPAAGA